MISFTVNKYHKGFTLFEMIIVMTILSIILVIGSNIVISLIKGQRLIKNESQLITDVQLTNDRIKKQLRNALPFSPRVTNNRRCLTFLPIIAGGFYLSPLPDQSNALPPSGRSSPIPVSSYYAIAGENINNAIYISVGAGGNSELYGNNSRSLVEVRSRTNADITLERDHQWQRNSLRQKFYLIGSVKAFCLIGDELRYYNNVTQTASNVDLSSSYDLLVRSVNAINRVFSVDDGSSGCQHCVTLSLEYTNADYQLSNVETVALRYDP